MKISVNLHSPLRRRLLDQIWFGLWLACSSLVLADGPKDNLPEQVRPVPPIGIQLADEVERELRERAQALQQRLQDRLGPAASQVELRRRDLCEVTARAVLMSLDTEMFYAEKDIDAARNLLAIGEKRLEQLNGGADELQLLGLPTGPDARLEQPLAVAGGFRSRIDNTVQPYGLILPAGWSAPNRQPMRLDVWLHGRGENVSEVAFLQQRMRQLGEYTPPNTVVLHPYGRYSNAFKFAGEIDVLEAIEHIKQFLPIDDGRIVIRGFSMGGAGCWQLAVHYPELWAAANPGAGFSETRQFLRVFQGEEIQPTDFQQRLLHWYDCPDWTNNLRQVPTVAYSGEIDRQKQAADVMSAAFSDRGLHLPHVIGPNTAHKIHADSKIEIERFLANALLHPKPRVPQSIDLTTYSLRYHRLGWLSIEGLAEHWRESRVQAEFQEQARQIDLTTSGVTRLRLQFPDDEQVQIGAIRQVKIDGQSLPVLESWPAPQLPLTLIRDASGRWSIASADAQDDQLRKRPGMQGPIDDAFMDKFMMLGPTTSIAKTAVDDWAKSEYHRAAREWKRHFRGEAPLGDSTASPTINWDQNVVLFGRPSTNRWLAKVVKDLPIQWDDETLVVNGKSYPAATHVPVLVYPSPANPEHYVVINSGFTYREYAYLNNARQVPMLPDWAVVDISTGTTTQLPGTIVDAGFFDEQWQFSTAEP